MIIPDANLLIYAHDASSPFHARARNWWESILSGREPVGIPFIVILAFMRLTTHAALNENPMSVAMARERVESWEDVPIVRFLSGSPAILRLAWDLLQRPRRVAAISPPMQ